jgi:hypothetical protein
MIGAAAPAGTDGRPGDIGPGQTGKALGAPVLTDLRAYPVKVVGGTVYIDVS